MREWTAFLMAKAKARRSKRKVSFVLDNLIVIRVARLGSAMHP
jgi:hypothetical protein